MLTFFDKSKDIPFEPHSSLRLIQPDTFNAMCDVKGCFSRNTKLYTDDDHKAFVICDEHMLELMREKQDG